MNLQKRINRINLSLIASLLVVVALTPQESFAQEAITDEQVKAILRDRVDRAKKSLGIVVGLVDDKGVRVIGFGKPNSSSDQPLDGDSVFEIGSATKVFTAILLADMVERGEMNLDDPISRYLPKSVKSPTWDGKEITLRHLANHTSGLPRNPGNLNPKDPRNPLADYSVEQMYEFLSSYALTREMGAKYEYSNLGGGLLGHILALRAGTDFETLLRTRICRPLKMDDTRVTLTPEMKARLTGGHNPSLQPTPNWDLPTLAGAGALRSTVNDLLRFLAANLGMNNTPLSAPMQQATQVRRETGAPGLEIGLGWHILKRFDTEMVWHNGATGGYHSFLGFDLQMRRGVVVLSNSTNDIDDIGRHLLDNRFPLARIELASERKAIRLDPKIFDAYAGEYQLAPGRVLTLSREDDRFFLQLTGQQKFELFAEAETEFFLTVVEASLSIVKDDKGQVLHLVLHQNNRDLEARRIR